MKEAQPRDTDSLWFSLWLHDERQLDTFPPDAVRFDACDANTRCDRASPLYGKRCLMDNWTLDYLQGCDWVMNGEGRRNVSGDGAVRLVYTSVTIFRRSPVLSVGVPGVDAFFADYLRARMQHPFVVRMQTPAEAAAELE